MSNSNDWRQKFGYYLTYLGEIYHGIAVQKDIFKGDFFIIPKNKWFAFNEKRRENEIALENFGVYIAADDLIHGWMDENAIQHTVPNYSQLTWNGDPHSFKRMFVFGAGASAFSQFGDGKEHLENFNLRPPLGIDIFANRFDPIIENYPGVRLNLARFESQGNNIEAILEDDWSQLMKSLNKSLASQHIQIQYFIQELFQTISEKYRIKFPRYSVPNLFVNKLARESTKNNKSAIVSFNYDTILDEAFEAYHKTEFTNLNDYSNWSEEHFFSFFKPHGSWNWGWEFVHEKINKVEGNVRDWLYKENFTPAQIYYELLGPNMFSIEGWGIEVANNPEAIGKITPNKNEIKVMGNKVNFPALLLPYRDKDEFVMPYYQQMHLDNIMGKIEELILIGWKGNEKLFNKKLSDNAKNLKKIIIVNPKPDEVMETITEYLNLNDLEIVTVNDFESYVFKYMS